MGETIEIGYQAFVSDGGEEFGAVNGRNHRGRIRRRSTWKHTTLPSPGKRLVIARPSERRHIGTCR
jgi:hypothetical protein